MNVIKQEDIENMIEVIRNKRIYNFEVTYLSDNFNQNEDE